MRNSALLELYRLSEDESAVIQYYRLLPSDDSKAAFLSLLMAHADIAQLEEPVAQVVPIR